MSTSSPTPSSESKTTTVYEQLRHDLTRGDIEPGQRLAESALVRRYGVSRTPVREALIRLEHDGLIERRGNTVFARQRSPQEVLDIYRVRVFLEGAVAASAAQRRTETDLIRIEAAVVQGEAATSADGSELQDLNTRFHEALADASHNATLVELQGRLTRQIARLPSTTLTYPGRWDTTLAEHRAIFDAIRTGDADRAEQLARDHMQAACDIRLALMAVELSE